MFLITYKYRNYAKTVVFHHYRVTLAWVTDPEARNLEHTDRSGQLSRFERFFFQMTQLV